MRKFTEFLGDDAGAVTIDWVALTASILLLGIVTVYAIFNGSVPKVVLNINTTLSNVASGVDTGTVPTLGECLKTKKNGNKCVK